MLIGPFDVSFLLHLLRNVQGSLGHRRFELSSTPPSQCKNSSPFLPEHTTPDLIAGAVDKHLLRGPLEKVVRNLFTTKALFSLSDSSFAEPVSNKINYSIKLCLSSLLHLFFFLAYSPDHDSVLVFSILKSDNLLPSAAMVTSMGHPLTVT